MKINKHLIIVILTGFVYFFLYFYIMKNMSVWIYDLKNCFEVMQIHLFLINHINVFVYILLFLFMSFYIIKSLYVIGYEIKKLYETKRLINLLKLKDLHNIVVIDTSEKVVFNFFNKIVIYKDFFKAFSKQEKKAVFNHEKAHLENNDGIKLLISNIILSLFPQFLKEKFFKYILLDIEVNADRKAVKSIGKINLAKTLLKFNSTINPVPMANNLTDERIRILLENKEVKLPLSVYIIYSIFVVLFLAITIYKTCFCGVM